MKTKRLLQFYLIFLLTCFLNFSWAQSGIYGGGPVYKNRSYSINELKGSGFTYVVVWTIHIDASGNFNFNAEFPLVQNGAYIGNNSYPNFAGDVASLKTGTTSIRRVEFALSAWGSSTFDHVRDLINSQGTGTSSILYRNFQALRNTFPTLDAISFDDEKTYDANTATRLAVMLRDIGFKVTLCPYTNSAFWSSVASNTNSQRPGAIDRIDVQCYAGGAGNNPCNWNFGGIPVSAGLWDAERSSSSVQSQLTTWKNQCSGTLKGGFIWLYDDIDNSALTKQYATAVNNVFPSTPPPTGIVSGATYSIVNVNSNKAMEVSNFSTADGGNVQQWDYVGAGSQKWRVTDVGGGTYSLININSGKCLDVSGVSTADGANVHQWAYVGGNNQKWQIIDNGDGTYRIIAAHSGKAAEVSNFSTTNGGNVQQWAYVGVASQKWRFTQVAAAREVTGDDNSSLSFNAEDGDVELFPNPVVETLNIKGDGIKEVHVFNSTGQLVKKVNVPTVEMGSLPTGIYHVLIKSERFSRTKRVSKQ